MESKFNTRDTIQVDFNICNTTNQHTDFIVGCSLVSLDGSVVVHGEWGIKYLSAAPMESAVGVLYLHIPEITPAGEYTFYIKSWTQRSGGSYVEDRVIEGVSPRTIWFIYAAGTGSLTGVVDEDSITVTISDVTPPPPPPPVEGVSAEITGFSLSLASP